MPRLSSQQTRNSLLWLLLSSIYFYSYSVDAAKPVGLHLDIEVHSLPGWDHNGGTQTQSMANQWLDLLEKIKAETGEDIPLTVDFAMQYSVIDIERNGVTKLLGAHAFDIVDNAVLMAYRDYAVESDCPETMHKKCAYSDGIRFHTDALLDLAVAGSHSVKLGVETNSKVIPDKVSFGLEGEAYMERVLKDTVEYFQPNLELTGVVVHDFISATDTAFTDVALRPSASERSCRSVWMWDDRYVLSKDGLSPEDLVPIIHAHSIDNIVLASRWFFKEYKPDLEKFVDIMGQNGISVELLLANHEWSLSPGHDEVISLVQDAVSFINEMSGVVENRAQCAPIAKLLYIEDFEDGFGKFMVKGSGEGALSQEHAKDGLVSLKLNKGKSSKATTGSFVLTGGRDYKQLKVGFWLRFGSMEKKKGVQLKYRLTDDDGAGKWKSAKQFKRTNKVKNNKWYKMVVMIDVSEADGIELQFRSTGSKKKMNVFIDGVTFEGFLSNHAVPV